ncbi:MAG TPA: FAD-dependent oxidoreductase, partial [Deltaproteobacteria bacterium]|nr:FAD-dependent oxidoreductase [Deltaproteobacteria bacterium]
MGSPFITVEVHAPASDDVGWLNAGATIIVHGDATNGVANAMAQGRIYIAGDIGARGMTMTKHNPRFDPPELWVLGGTGDSFAEFMAGGIAVVCGIDSRSKEGYILGHRPCVGMVGGKIFFRGHQKEISDADAVFVRITDEEWDWLRSGLSRFLKAIGKEYLEEELTHDRSAWELVVARRPSEKRTRDRIPMGRFRKEVWDRELGPGGLIGDISKVDSSRIGVIETGELRRFVPHWENESAMSPCQAACPTGIPVQKRWSLVRMGEIEKAVDLALAYTPFPATVCGYLCPNLCMEACTRRAKGMTPVDTSVLGRASIEAKDPSPSPPSGRKVAIIGGGPAGLSVAWQLWMKGHDPVVFDRDARLGGKIRDVIPFSRIPKEVFDRELRRVEEKITRVRLEDPFSEQLFEDIVNRHDFTVIAVGANDPRTLSVKGARRTIAALDFLRAAKRNKMKVKGNVVVIGAGNVGCDVATEAYRLGASSVTLVDIQKPASFGKEREAAEALGAKFVWPVRTERITDDGVVLSDGSTIPADMVVVSIGDTPNLEFLPDTIDTESGMIRVDERYRTSRDRVYAIGDCVRQGLITDAIGAGRIVASDIDARLKGEDATFDRMPSVDVARIRLEYYEPQALTEHDDLASCAQTCASCGLCRDCGMCEAVCPTQAISRRELQGGLFENAADPGKCIGCGFCAG